MGNQVGYEFNIGSIAIFWNCVGHELQFAWTQWLACLNWTMEWAMKLIGHHVELECHVVNLKCCNFVVS